MLSLIAGKQWRASHQGAHRLAHLCWRCSRRARGHLDMQPLSLRRLSSPFTPRLLISDPPLMLRPLSFFCTLAQSPSINLFLPGRSSSLGSCGQLDGFVFDTCVGGRRRTPPHTHTHTCKCTCIHTAYFHCE